MLLIDLSTTIDSMNIKSVLGPLEQEVMTCLWEKEVASVREVHACLNKSRKIAYTTVMTVMNRLVEKGLLTRSKQGRTYWYSPNKTKRQSLRTTVDIMIHSLMNQYGSEAVTAFTDELKKRR